MHASKFGGDKNARLTETHTLEVRTTRRCFDSLFISNTGHKPNEQVLLRQLPINHYFRTKTCVPNCYGAEMSNISGPQLVFSENNTILNEYRNNFNENELKLVFCRDKKEHWHQWMN